MRCTFFFTNTLQRDYPFVKKVTILTNHPSHVILHPNISSNKATNQNAHTQPDPSPFVIHHAPFPERRHQPQPPDIDLCYIFHHPRFWGPPLLGTPASGDPRFWGPPLLGAPASEAPSTTANTNHPILFCATFQTTPASGGPRFWGPPLHASRLRFTFYASRLTSCTLCISCISCTQ